MFLRSAAAATALSLGGAAFVAGAVAGVGLTTAALGTACLARRALKRRRDWAPDAAAEAPEGESGLPATP